MTNASYTPLPQRENDEASCGTGASSHVGLKVDTPRPSPLHPVIRSSRSIAIALFRAFNFSLLNPDEWQGQFNARRVRNHGIRTDWLDGMRGVASFIVFIFHHSVLHFRSVRWAYNAEKGQDSILQLPYIRVLWCGSAMVSIFFVISGYALSISHLKLIHAQKYDQLLRRLSSSVFRRSFRLFVPSIVAAFIYYLCLGFGLLKDVKPHSFETQELLYEMIDMIDPFHGPEVMIFIFNDSLWTIPVEFRGSLVLFVTLLGLARLEPLARMIILHALFFFFMYRGRWDMSLFMAGAFLAESSLLAEKSSSYAELTERTNEDVEIDIEKVEIKTTLGHRYGGFVRLVKNGTLVSILMVGVYMLTYPEAGTSPFYDWLPTFGIQDEELVFRVHLSIGAVIVTTVISFMPRCQALFRTKTTSYLGEISFALYLTHNLVNRVVGARIVHFVWGITGQDTWIRVRVGFFIATVLYIPFVIWVADVFWRIVDVPSVHLAKRIERFCSVSSQPAPQ